MNFQQLRSVREAIQNGYNLTQVAQNLHTSQPNISRQIRELEGFLGIEIFVRQGKRITGLTGPGENVLPHMLRILDEAENLRRASQEHLTSDSGVLTLAATHTQARYALPLAVQEFRLLYPKVKLNLHQGSPNQIADLLLKGEADVGIATEALADYEGLVALPCYRWTHAVIVPPNHPLLKEELTIEQLARFPLITYDSGFTGRGHINQAFAKAGVKPNIVLSAMDADVIKTYVEQGMGVGIVASIAFEHERDTGLRAIDPGHLFGVNVTRLAIRKGRYLRGYVYRFIELFSPSLERDVVRAAVEAELNANDTEMISL